MISTGYDANESSPKDNLKQQRSREGYVNMRMTKRFSHELYIMLMKIATYDILDANEGKNSSSCSNLI